MRMIAALLTLGLLLLPASSSRQEEAAAPAKTLYMAVANRLEVNLRPVDPLTLQDVPGRAPISLGHHFDHAFSPDRRTLAVVVYGTDTLVNGSLRLIDLERWQVRETGILLERGGWHLGYTEGGEAIWWLAPGKVADHAGPDREFALYRYREGAPAERVAQLAADFVPRQARLLGDRLAIYGVPEGSSSLPGDAPHLLLISLTSGQVEAEIPLEGVLDGMLGTGPENFHYEQPGLAWDLPNARLYVVESATDRVTVVDLAAGKVLKREAIQPRTALGERLRQWWMPTAAAKVMTGTLRQAIVSPDGERLYLFGHKWDHPQPPAGMPLQLVATGSLKEMGSLEVEYGGVHLTPDGRHLLVDGTQGLHLIAADTLRKVATLEPYVVNGFSSDGRQVYLHGLSGDAGIRRLDLQTRRYEAPRGAAGHMAWLIGF